MDNDPSNPANQPTSPIPLTGNEPVIPPATPPANPQANFGPRPLAPAPQPAPPPAAPAAPHYENHKLTRAGMEQAIREGGSVAYHGRVIARIDDLPSAAELASGDTDAERRVRDDIRRRRELLDREESQLLGDAAAPERKTTTVSGARPGRPK